MLLLKDFPRQNFTSSSQKVPKEWLRILEISTFVAILLKQKVYKIIQFFTVIYRYFPLSSPNFLNVERTRNAVDRLKPAPEFKSLHLRQRTSLHLS